MRRAADSKTVGRGFESHLGSKVIMERYCMYCHTPIYECMGFVIPRDALALLEGAFPEGQVPRELCPSKECNDKWLKFLEEENEES